MDKIEEYRLKSKQIIDNSYAMLRGFQSFGVDAYLVANNDLVESLKLGQHINKKSVINNIKCGTYDKKLIEYFERNENKETNNKIAIEKKFDNPTLQMRHEEIIKAINNNMPLSFFWLAGSIIEGVLCEYCKKNNIKSNKDDIDGYITALENNNKISKGSTIYTTLQHFRLFRNTIHPNNQNNDFINDKNLQNRKEELDDVIKHFTH